MVTPSISKSSLRRAIVRAPQEDQLLLWTGGLLGEPTKQGPATWWSQLPRWVFSRAKFFKSVRTVASTFTFKGEQFDVIHSPGMVYEGKGVNARLAFPGAREEVVYRMLMLMAGEQTGGRPLHADMGMSEGDALPHVRIAFHLRTLRERLAETGHTYDTNQIKEALVILNGSTLELRGRNRRVRFSQIAYLAGKWVDDGMADPDRPEETVVALDVFTSEDLLRGRMWLVPTTDILQLGAPLARWILDRICSRYRQAAHGDVSGYTLGLTTVLNESGIVQEPRMRDNVARVREALKELRQAGHLRIWKEESILDEAVPGQRGRRAVADVRWNIFPSPALVERIIGANVEMRRRRFQGAGGQPPKAAELIRRQGSEPDVGALPEVFSRPARSAGSAAATATGRSSKARKWPEPDSIAPNT